MNIRALRSSALRRPATAGLLIALAAGLGGCTLVNLMIAQLAPPKKVPAVYEPPTGERYLVFVDDLVSPVGYEPIKRELTERLNRQLIAHDIAAAVVPYEDLLDLAASRDDFNSMHVPTVGEQLGAEQVLYVSIERFALKDDEVSPLWRGRLDLSVKIVDVEVGRLWPPDRQSGYPVETIETEQTENASSTYGAEVARELAEKASDRVAKLFYEHEVPAHDLREEAD